MTSAFWPLQPPHDHISNGHKYAVNHRKGTNLELAAVFSTVTDAWTHSGNWSRTRTEKPGGTITQHTLHSEPCAWLLFNFLRYQVNHACLFNVICKKQATKLRLLENEQHPTISTHQRLPLCLETIIFQPEHLAFSITQSKSFKNLFNRLKEVTVALHALRTSVFHCFRFALKNWGKDLRTLVHTSEVCFRFICCYTWTELTPCPSNLVIAGE